LIVEENTPLARRIAAGELPAPDEDDLADKYIRADELFNAAGLQWYEVSNWAKPGLECQHNLRYWRSQEWCGIGAGAHSYLNGIRSWNLRFPPTYITALKQYESPTKGFERLTEDQIRIESIMLGMRLSTGVDHSLLSDTETAQAATFVASGHLIDTGSHLIPTLMGRLTADRILRDILD